MAEDQKMDSSNNSAEQNAFDVCSQCGDFETCAGNYYNETCSGFYPDI